MELDDATTEFENASIEFEKVAVQIEDMGEEQSLAFQLRSLGIADS